MKVEFIMYTAQEDGTETAEACTAFTPKDAAELARFLDGESIDSIIASRD